MAIDYKPDQNEYKNMTPFKTWLIYQINTWGVNNFPFLENDFDQLTNYGMMMKLMKAVNDNITNQNLVEDDMSKLYIAFTELQDYINNYFDNLDVQDEINNKLDQMVEDGVLEQIIEQYINSTALWTFNTVQDLKESTNLINGSYAKTLGFYNIKDGGESIYKIREIEENETPDEMSIISLNNGLCAELIYNDKINIKQLGAVGNDTADDSLVINKALNMGINVFFNNGTYLLKSHINAINVKSIDGCDAIIDIVHTDNTLNNPDSSHGIQFKNLNGLTIKNIKFIDSTITKSRFSFNITFENCKNVIIDKIEIDGNCGAGLTFWKNCEYAEIKNSYIHDTYADGIHIQRGCKYFTIKNNNITKTQDDCIGFVTYDTTIYGKCSNIIIDGNHLSLTDVAGSGVAIAGSDNTTIINNTIESTYYGALRFVDKAGDDNTHAYPNNIYVANNIMKNTGTSSSTLKRCIYTNYISNVTIVDNVIDGNTSTGISLSNARGKLIIKNNRINNVEDGIIITDSTTNFADNFNVLINNNLMSNLIKTAIQVNGQNAIANSYVYVESNIIDGLNTGGSGTTGIAVLNQNNVRISNNIINPTNSLASVNSYYQTSSANENCRINNCYPVSNARESTYIGTCKLTVSSTPPTTATAGDLCINLNPSNSSHIAFWYCTVSSSEGVNATWKQVNFTN